MSDQETKKVTETGPSKTTETTKPAPAPQPDQGGQSGGQSGGNGSDKPNG